jgi:hypothetical protein
LFEIIEPPASSSNEAGTQTAPVRRISCGTGLVVAPRGLVALPAWLVRPASGVTLRLQAASRSTLEVRSMRARDGLITTDSISWQTLPCYPAFVPDARTLYLQCAKHPITPIVRSNWRNPFIRSQVDQVSLRKMKRLRKVLRAPSGQCHLSRNWNERSPYCTLTRPTLTNG